MTRFAARHRVMAAFVLHATTVGALFSRLPEVQARLGLGEAAFGLALMAMPLGVVLGSVLTPALIGRLGPRRLLLAGLPLCGLLLLPVALAPGLAGLALALAAFGLAFATGNLAINVEADRIEAAWGVRILNRCHGWWAIGFLATALVAPLLIRWGVAPAAHFGALAVALAVATPAALMALPVSAPRAGAASGRRFAIPGRGTVMIGAYAMAGIAMEGVSRSWSVIYLRDTFGAVEWVAALALPVVMAMQTAGRFAGDRLVTRFGDVGVGRSMAAILAAGLATVVLAPNPAVAVLGFAVVGLGVSIVMPQAFAAAARRGDRPAAEAMGAFATLSSVFSFAAPPLFGAVAAGMGLRVAFALFLPLALVAVLAARQLGVRAAAPLDSATGAP